MPRHQPSEYDDIRYGLDRGGHFSEQDQVEEHDRIRAAGYLPERTEMEWRTHWDRYPEMYAALWGVVFTDRTRSEMTQVIVPHYADAPEVEPWVTSDRRLPRQRRAREQNEPEWVERAAVFPPPPPPPA